MTQTPTPPALSEEQTRRILQAVDAHFDAQLAFTQDLVRFPSLREQEHTAQDFLYEAMQMCIRDRLSFGRFLAPLFPAPRPALLRVAHFQDVQFLDPARRAQHLSLIHI